MGNPSDSLLIALIATLETRARKKGAKSVVKALVAHLTANGADPATIAEVAALQSKSVVGKTLKAPKPGRKAATRAAATSKDGRADGKKSKAPDPVGTPQ